MKSKSSNISLVQIIIIEVITIVISFYSGFFIRGLGKLSPSSETFPLIYEAYDILQKNFLKELPEQKEVEYQMVRGMVETYHDAYTIFVEPQQHELQTDQLNGKFGGIGCSIEKINEGIFILHPFTDAPAEKAGIRDGDELVSVDQLQITDRTTVEDIQAAIRGPVGQKTVITVRRISENTPIVLEVRREEVSLPSVTWNIVPGESSIGILHINIIAATTVDELENGFSELQKSGATEFILDLRNNSGGLVDAGVEIVRMFLSEGVILQQQYRDQPVEIFKAEKPGEFTDIPLVVFINDHTASAAEIIAGALQANQRAPLIGIASYGKDSIQLIYNLSDDSSLHVTSAHWWLSGYDESGITGIGLTPDIRLAAEHQNEEDYIQSAKDYFENNTNGNQGSNE